MQWLIKRLRSDFPEVNFLVGNELRWSFTSRTVIYTTDSASELGILHELGHALLGHSDYRNDVALLLCETAAWSEARRLAAVYEVVINEDRVEDCLDSYREWLHRRSLCPTCGSHGVQEDVQAYRCANCASRWRVSSNRFCRVYRKQYK